MNNDGNIFNVTDPDTCYCKVWRYHSGHSRLLLRIDQDKSYEKTIYIVFTSVFYYAGPTSWVGCNFRIAELKEALETLHQIDLYGVGENEVGEEFSRTYPLFIGGTSNINKVNIMASKNFQKSNKFPFETFPDT